MDSLKNYFRKHERDMQVEAPDESGMWARMEARQKQHRPKRVTMMAMRFAAAACILLLIGLGIRQWIAADDQPGTLKEGAQASTPLKKELVPDTANEEGQPVIVRRTEEKSEQQDVRFKRVKKAQPVDVGLTQLVAYRLERLRRTPVYAETPEFFTEFGQQLQQMDADEALLKKDMETYGFNDRLVEALVTIYEQKLNLLEGLQSEIKKMNATVKKGGLAGTPHPYYLTL